MFFSNLATKEFEATAHHAFNHRGPLGTLGALLDRLARPSTRFDYRVKPWDDLMPSAFRPQKIERNEFDAFIAYNTEDKPAVLGVCDILRRHGVYPWIDLE